jgi:hypothetical protein
LPFYSPLFFVRHFFARSVFRAWFHLLSLTSCLSGLLSHCPQSLKFYT